MKNIFLISFALLSIAVFGQENNEGIPSSKHELSIVIDDIFAKTSYVNYPYLYSTSSLYYLPAYPTFELNTTKVGLGYKFHFKNSALRSKLSLGVRNNTTENKIDTNKTENSFLASGITLGYEFHKNIRKTQIFYGADLYVDYNKSSSKSSNVYNSETYINESINTNMAFGISPLVGVKYFISPSISFSTELKFFIESFKNESIYKYTGNTSDNKNDTSGMNTKFGPLGQLSINIHF